LVKDMAAAPLSFNPITLASASIVLQATEGFVADTTAPTIASFTFDIDTSKMVITASEALLASSLKPEHVHLYDNTLAEHVKLTAASTASLVSDKSGKVVNIDIAIADMNNIKANTKVAVSAASTVLVVVATFATDAAGIAMAAVGPADGKKPETNGYQPDTIHPELSSFTLNLATNKLTMTFTESMKTAGFDPSKIAIISSKSASPPVRVALTSASELNTETTVLNKIDVDLCDFDLDALKGSTAVGTLDSNTYLELGAGTAQDTKSLALTAISGVTAKKAAQVTPDTVKPTLKSFSLSMKY